MLLKSLIINIFSLTLIVKSDVSFSVCKIVRKNDCADTKMLSRNSGF